MSATIILIMTSSSTRNTDPRAGRIALILPVLAHPQQVPLIRHWEQCQHSHMAQ
jgi:hypothetical protein